MAFALSAVPALALINPNFTPVHLAREAKSVSVVELGGATDDAIAVRVTSQIKGKGPALASLDLAASDAVGLDTLREGLGDRKSALGLLLTGDFSKAGGSGQLVPDAMLQVGVKWVALSKPTSGGGGWVVAEDPSDLSATWAGSAEMLAEAMRYILEDPRAEVPTVAGAKLAPGGPLGAVDPGVQSIRVIEIGGRALLWVAAPGGDRLVAAGPGSASGDDLAGTMELKSRSRAGAWGEFSRDGGPDLISWTGKELELHTLAENGRFATTSITNPPAACDQIVGAGERFVTRAPEGLTLWASDAAGKWFPTPVRGGGAGPVASADFDGDGEADLVQVDTSEVLWRKGGGAAGFGEPVRSAIRGLGAAGDVAISDFDNDGKLDLVVAAKAGPRVLVQRGEGRFDSLGAATGELDYHTRGKGTPTGLGVGDFNQDGRPDVAAFYAGNGVAPMLFFNRGFGSFGFARELGVGESRLPGVAEMVAEGQRGGALADLDGDGATELAVLCADGSIRTLRMVPDRKDVPGLRVSLPKATAGPVTVAATDGPRNLGARAVGPGASALYWIQEPGPIELRWRAAGAAEQKAEVGVERPDTTFELGTVR